MAEVTFLIYSREHNAWWGPNRSGYRVDIENAGRYSEDEADSIIASCGPRGGMCGEGPHEFKMLAPEALAAAREQAEADSVMADGCLAMICDLLTALGTDMKSTPPMFYPEAIKATIYRIVTEERTKAREQATSDAYSLISQAVHARGVLDCTDFERGPVVRKVLGTLPLTLDGCVVGNGANVWHKSGAKWFNYLAASDRPMEQLFVAGECHSTEEAAAKSARPTP